MLVDNPNDFQQNISLELLAKQVVEGFITGLHKSPFHGFSVEFAEHRFYNPGDNIKNIDWKLFAKTEKFFVKRFEEETNLRCKFILDISSSMYFPDDKYNKLKFAAQSIAVLMQLLKRQRDAFGLTLFADKLIFNSQVKSTFVHQKFLLSKLEELIAQPSSQVKTDLPSALHQVAELVHKRSLIVVFTDMLYSSDNTKTIANLFEAVQHLKFNKHEVILFNVLDRAKEVQFDYGNRPMEFVDMESGLTLKVQHTQAKKSYQERMIAFQNEIQLRCAQYKIDLVNADIFQGFYPVLESYLIKRQKM